MTYIQFEDGSAWIQVAVVSCLLSGVNICREDDAVNRSFGDVSSADVWYVFSFWLRTDLVSW